MSICLVYVGFLPHFLVFFLSRVLASWLQPFALLDLSSVPRLSDFPLNRSAAELNENVFSAPFDHTDRLSVNGRGWKCNRYVWVSIALLV